MNKKEKEQFIRDLQERHRKKEVDLMDLINGSAMQIQADLLAESARKHSEQYMEQESLNELRKKSTDELLDEYNDYKSLYDVFQDDHYKRRADMVMAIIKGKNQNRAS
jgi:hypothetical protein